MIHANARIGWPALAAGVLGIGCSGVFIQLSDVGPTALGMYRLLLALPVLGLWMALETRHDRAPLTIRRRDWALLGLAGLLFAGDLIAWHAAIRLTGVANATFMAHLAPIVVTFGGWFLFRERVTGGFVAGLVTAIAGITLLMGTNALAGSGDLLGDGLGVVTAVFYGAYLLTVKQLRGRLPTGTIMAVSGGFGCVAVTVAALISGEVLVPQSLFGWAMVLAIGLVSHAGGQSLITLAFRHIPASLGSVALLATPVVAAAVAWLALGESLTPLQIVGCAVILVGIAIAQRFGVRG